ncbi:MAG: hypothetical protein ACRD4T_12265, partial [Candidatus Acidiferrales bacterium]
LLLSTVAFAAPAFSQGGKNTGPQLVKDVDQPARQPWTASVQIPLSNLNKTGVAQIPTPADKRVVIESYSGAACATHSTIYLEGQLGIVTNGDLHAHFLHFNGLNYASGATAATYWSGTGVVRLYPDPGSDIVVYIGRSMPPYPWSTTCQITLSGYLVDIP